MSAQHAPDGCRLHRLAANRLGQVALCPECAALHLSVQCLTLRMDPAAFMQLVEMMVQARQRLIEAGGALASEAAAESDVLQGALH